MFLHRHRLPALKRGLVAGGSALLFLALAAAPARIAGACRMAGPSSTRALWTIAGVLRDVSAIVFVIAPAIFLVAGTAPLALARLRKPRWQRVGAMAGAAPFGFAIWLFGITAQEFKVERGVYPTVFDLSEGISSSVFLKGSLGFLRYDVYWIPTLIFGVAALALLFFKVRRAHRDAPVAWRSWQLGVGVALALGAGALHLLFAVSSPRGRLSPATLGDPFRVIMESSFDWMLNRGKVTPRDLVRDAKVPAARAEEGAALVGWPPHHPKDPTAKHPHARPLDRSAEPAIADPRGRELVQTFEEISARLFPLGDDRILVWQLTLESFRADDLHSMNPLAPRGIAPFVNALYEDADRDGGGVLASRGTYQAGVRTAQGLGALACGLGTLPYNLSVVRDLHPLPLRCLSDVLHDAGFGTTFFYGSDVTFDGMDVFFRAHGIDEIVSQPELPKDAPTGAWGAVTDLALVDEAARRVGEMPPSASRFLMLTTLSNHSPFTLPHDLPEAVETRVRQALATTQNHAASDDRPRVMTHSYTDAAVARFFERLDAVGLTSRSIVVLAADHSTGEEYVWGPDEPEKEASDDAKAKIPFAIVLPRALRDRARDRAALDDAIRAAQRALAAAPLSQNDIPSLLLALLERHPALASLPANARWHTLGGQVTSPWFRPMPRPGAYVMGVNGISQLVALDRAGARVGDYEESVFLKTRGDLDSVTPSLVPITATLSALLRTSESP